MNTEIIESPDSNTELVVSGLKMPPIFIPSGTTRTRDEAVVKAQSVLSVSNAEEQKEAVEAMSNLRSLAKRMESSRELVKRPVLDIGKAIDTLAKDFSNPITQEVNRLNLLISTFQREEDARVEKKRQEEEAARRKIFEDEERKKAELQKKADAAKNPVEKMKILQKIDDTEAKATEAVQESLRRDIANAPARAAGMVVRKDWKHRVIDIKTLYTARPELCVIEPNNAMIRGMISGGVRECPGLEIYQDFNTGTRG